MDVVDIACKINLTISFIFADMAISDVNFKFCTVFAICQVGSDMVLLAGKGLLPIHSI